MKKTLLVLALSLCVSTLTFAQAQVTPKKISRIGLQVGMNSPKMVFTKISDPNFYPDVQSFSRINAGIYSESGATDNFVFQIGIFYSGAGYKTDNVTETLDYVQVPFIFNFRTDIYEELFLTLGGGFYGGYAFSGKSESDNVIDRDILSMKEADEVKPYFFFDGGLLLKADFEYTFNNDKVVKLGVGYHFGIVEVSNEYTIEEGLNSVTYDYGAKNRIFSINATYLINLKKDKKEPVAY